MRLTTAYYGALIVFTAVAGPPPLPALTDALVGLASLLLVLLAALGRIWCSAFIAGRKDAELVTGGPYALCRHPLYLLSMVGGLGIGLATRSIALTAATLAVLVALLTRAANAEERNLASRHAAEFAAYAARVPRWWPRWHKPQLPDSAIVQPPVLWKAFIDAGAFVLLYALTSLAFVLRTGGFTPTLIQLP